MIFIFLVLGYLFQYVLFQLHQFLCKIHDFIFLTAVVFCNVYVSYFHYLFVSYREFRLLLFMAQEASVEYDAESCQQHDCLNMSLAQMKTMIMSLDGKKTQKPSTLHKEIQANKKSWEEERQSFSGKSTPVDYPMPNSEL